MKHIGLLYIAFTIIISPLMSQAPSIEWENTIGGNSYEILNEIRQTSDGGYIMSGYSNSDLSGEKTEENCNTTDFWIIKLTESGTIQWQNTIGGESSEEACFIFETESGDFIVAGSSASSKNCDKTSNSYGGSDFWILKINSVGVIIYQMKIGSDDHDLVTALEPTADGGFIVGGTSSAFGGVSGNKTDPGVGLNDYYVVKISATGTIEWQNAIGTTADDFLTSLKPCSDGGYILGGYTTGGISGDKTEASMSPGYEDYWVVKLDASGNIQWQNTIGGNFNDYCYSVIETPYAGFLIGGNSNSGISGDKTESSLGTNWPWILKLNSTGSIVWQNTIQSGPYSLFDMINTADGNYVLSGGDFWICKLNVLGDIMWSQTIGSGYNPRSIQQTSDLGYIMGGISNSGITAVKSEPNYGDADYWIVKLAPDVCMPVDELCNSLDDNCNGIADDGVIETVSIAAGGPTTFCKGSSVTLTATYSGTTLQWKKNGSNIPGATSSTYNATAAGNYSCVTNSACGSAESEMIEVVTLKKPDAFIYADGPTLFCAGGSVTLIANSGGGLAYQWYKGASAIAGATSISYTATTAGNYKCLVTKITNGCSKQSNAIAVSVPCRENELSISGTTVYPNPASDNVTIQTTITGDKFISVYDVSGNKIKEFQSTDENIVMDIKDFPKGLYFIKITNTTGSEVGVFIKE